MPLRAFILQNLWLKIFSLFFATLIWFAIQPNRSEYKFPHSLFPPRVPTLELRCPVTVMTSPDNRATWTVEPREVLVKVQGEEAVLRKLTPESIQAYINLIDVRNLSRLFRVEVIVPRDVTLEEVMPDQVTVQSAASTEK